MAVLSLVLQDLLTAIHTTLADVDAPRYGQHCSTWSFDSCQNEHRRDEDAFLCHMLFCSFHLAYVFFHRLVMWALHADPKTITL